MSAIPSVRATGMQKFSVMNSRNALAFSAVLVIILFLNLPLVSALEISNVRAVNILHDRAVIEWETDEPADSFVHYGVAGTDQATGDASPVTEHRLSLQGLTPETAYLYAVESNAVLDDNEGQFYSLTTAAPDTTAPDVLVDLPQIVAGNELTLRGMTEPDVNVSVYVQGFLAGKTFTTEEQEGRFHFDSLLLDSNQFNLVLVEAVDRSGNKASFNGTVFADMSRPEIQIALLPNVTDRNELELVAGISENVSFDIKVNERSVAQGAGNSIRETIRLDEGPNVIALSVTDTAGWITTEEVRIISDTRPPQVRAELERGNEFYQGRAVSTIHGETEPGATVFLYVFQPLGSDYTPEFGRAWASTTADSNGSFMFEDVNFEDEPARELLKRLAPQQVPEGLQEQKIRGVQQAAATEQFSYQIFLIAEDQAGRSGYTQLNIRVNTCFSGEQDFAVQSLAQFQAPLRLNPQLMDEGREVISAVFNLSYRGDGRATVDLTTGDVLNEGYEITRVDFDKACTQSMLDSAAEIFSRGRLSLREGNVQLGCQLLPERENALDNGKKSSWFVTWNLKGSRGLSDADEGFWDEFKNRQVVFPLKVRIQYQERDANGILGPTKSQAACTDLGYFIDVPIDSKDMLPDVIAEEGLEGIEWTIEKIDTVLPYIENAILVTGVGCISSWLGRMAVRWARLTVSKMEAFLDAAPGIPDNEKCPNTAGQNALYLRSTIEHWQTLRETGLFNAQENPRSMPRGNIDPENSLEEKCPKTASLWEFESTLDQAYKWTCDRVFCRAVPARWTEDRTKEQVDTVIQEQNQCVFTSRGVPLTKHENCQELIQRDVTNANQFVLNKMKNGSFTCFEHNDIFYVATSDQNDPLAQLGIVKFQKVHEFGLTYEEAKRHIGEGDLLAYETPPGSGEYFVGQDQRCDQVCRSPRKPGYRLDEKKSLNSFYVTREGHIEAGNFGCYREVKDSNGNIQLIGNDGEELKGTERYNAGYTRDCFIELDDKGNSKTPQTAQGETGLLSCVCAKDGREEQPLYHGAREAAKATDDLAEDWIYRQDALYGESRQTAGTYYPPWRYYGGRDFPSSFGANYLTDYLRPDGEEQVHEVNPHTQHVGTFQTLCLSGVRARLITLRSVLDGLRQCIEEAKFTGLKDAGVCKTIFSQHVCGLIYKSIAYFFNSCTPRDWSTVGKGSVLGPVGAAFDAGLSSIPEAMDSSIRDIQEDYGNAKLNEYFATGTQGFAQSMCMAAFGYDWPLGTDFILDAAYAFPTKTTVHAIPAERELSTFNPAKGTASYNYNIGAAILPGCKIQSYDVSLKCVGQEDLGHPNIECGEQGCDCLRATERSPLEGEKQHFLEGGRGFDLRQGSLFEVPIPSPQRVDKNFRYDHVVVDLKLNPFEDPATCFDEGYRDGKFYFPIIDISQRPTAVCQVEARTGRYFCPEIQSLFGGGTGAYIEAPGMSCWDEDLDDWVSCETPNLYTLGDVIKVRSHLVTDTNPYCLRTRVLGLGPEVQEELPILLPENMPGSHTQQLNLGTVREDFFSASSAATLLLTTASRSEGCDEPNIVNRPTTAVQQKAYTFQYSKIGDAYSVTVPADVAVIEQNGYTKENGKLARNGKTELTADEIRGAVFNFNGLQANNLIGAPRDRDKVCTYTTSTVGGTGGTTRTVTITTEVLLPDASGSCFNANTLVRAPAFGEAKHRQPIVLQKEAVVTQITGRMHDEFMRGNYAFVQQAAREIINRQRSDLDDAVAIFYSIASYIKQQPAEWKTVHGNTIKNLLKIFFTRVYDVQNRQTDQYPDPVLFTAEYKKIHTYLCETDARFDNQYGSFCGIAGRTGSATVCGKTEGLKPGFVPVSRGITAWERYSCKDASGRTDCLPWNEYAISREGGCPGEVNQQCCPP